MSRYTLVGFWKFKSNRVRLDDGKWLDENLSGGTMAFSESGHVCLFLRSAEQGPWGYSGKYEIKGDVMSIDMDASVNETVEQRLLERKFRFLSPNEFILTGQESETGRSFETHCYRV